MNNELIPTNSLWYRIKKFFKNIFFKEKEYDTKDIKDYRSSTSNNIINNNLFHNNNNLTL